jgi:hypothetical protein
VELRRHVNAHIAAKAMDNGDRLHHLLVEIAGPDCQTGLAIARRAWGDDLGSERDRRLRQQATLLVCAAHLPPRPGHVEAAERERRAGVSQADRDAAAADLAARMAP